MKFIVTAYAFECYLQNSWQLIFCCCSFRLIYFGGYGCRKHNELSDCFDVHDAFWVRDLSQIQSDLSFLIVKTWSFILYSVSLKICQIFLLFVASAEMQIAIFCLDLKLKILHFGSSGCSAYSKYPVLGFECNGTKCCQSRNKGSTLNLKTYFKYETPRKF